MEPLMTNKKVLMWLSVYPFADGASKWKKKLSILLAFYVFISQICSVVASVAFFLKFMSTDLERSLYAIFQVFACSSAAYGVGFAVVMSHEITNTIDKLSEIYKMCKSSIFF